MQDNDKRTLYGEAIRAPQNISHLTHIYTPHRREEYVISKEDFVKNSIDIYGSAIPLFKEYDITQGSIVGAIFKESEESLYQGITECKFVSDDNINIEENAHSYTKQYVLKSDGDVKKDDEKEEHNDSDDTEIIDGTYEYKSLSYESPYIEIINATYDDEKGRLDITLKTQDAVLVSRIIATTLGIDEKNVRVTTLPYTSNFDEYFISTIYASVVAAKAAEKFGANIEYRYRPYSVSPSFSVHRKTVVDRNTLDITHEDVEINVDCGTVLVFEEEISKVLFASSLPPYRVFTFNAKINLLQSSSNSTFFFSNYMKASVSSSSMEHLYAIAFKMGKQPILFLEEHIKDNFESYNTILPSLNIDELKNNYEGLLKSEDAYMQSSIFSLNDSKKGVFLSSISALNKAQSVSLFSLPSGLTKDFDKRNDFAFGALKDEDTSNVKLYIGTSTSIENKDRLDDALEVLKTNTKTQDLTLTLKGVPREKLFTIGPDIMRRHTTIALNAIKNAIVQKKIRKDFSLFPLLKDDNEVWFFNNFWGMSVFEGYKDFVTDEIVLTSVHMCILHSSSFDKDTDVVFYKQAVLRILSLFGVRLSSEFENRENFKIDFCESQFCFDALEGVFSLVLSGLRILSFMLSPKRKLLKDKEMSVKKKDSDAPKNDDSKEEVDAP